MADFTTLDPRKFILIKGARVHNLQQVDAAIPRNKLVVITGLSGSGKSSLAFDTLYAEGQRRYVESLSSYARQFVGRMDKPEVDYIKGISPAIAIEQKVNTRNPRSTVGTSTEIYDYLKLLFARVGVTYSPVSGHRVKRHSVQDVSDFILAHPEGTRLLLLAPFDWNPSRTRRDDLQGLLQTGFTRMKLFGEVYKIEELLEEGHETGKQILAEPGKPKKGKGSRTASPAPADSGHRYVVIDRLVVRPGEEDFANRVSDSVQTAFFEGRGECFVEPADESSHAPLAQFSNRFELDGMTFEEPSTHLFSFNNPFGACRTCEGFGSVIGIDEDLVIPDKSLSVYDGAIVCWRGEKMKAWAEKLIASAYKFDFPIHKPVYELTTEQRRLLWTGNRYFDGLDAFFQMVESQTYKIQYRVMLSRYRGRTICPECRGTRLRQDANYVKVGGKSISDLVLMPVKDCLEFFRDLSLDAHEHQVAKRILTEIRNRLSYLGDVGLGYLTLNRLSNSLSGGESQRINLATSLGSSLVGSLYILDEPSIGLHPRDTRRLIGVLRSLRDLGNTVVVVEHDDEIMQAADHLLDIGPEAGRLGGRLVFEGSYNDILKADTLTGRYLSGKDAIPVPHQRRKWKNCILVEGARENNLKNLTVKFPLGVMTVVTGVSGSGKTSLVRKVLYPALKKIHGGYGEQSGAFDKISGDYSRLGAVEMVDQHPIGKSSRSNPVTYVKAYDEIRALFAGLPLSRTRKYKPSHFSFNVEGGRCEVCEGEGTVTIEMQFMADIQLVCENCKGKRFKQETLDVTYRGKSVADVLDMTVDEAVAFFGAQARAHSTEARIAARLKPLQDVGLGYVHLGQPSSTLSGGEAQRIKLASFLTKGHGGESAGQTLFIFDEPTTGLHVHDIRKLLSSFDALLAQGHSILIIEHHPEVIKCADWVIDLGPEGGEAGGYLVFEGRPEELAACTDSHTGRFLAQRLAPKKPGAATVRPALS
jgi:excinuclease ABC subunit A